MNMWWQFLSPELTGNTHADKLDSGDGDACEEIQKVVRIFIVDATTPATYTECAVINAGDRGVMLRIDCRVNNGAGSEARKINARRAVEIKATREQKDRAATLIQIVISLRPATTETGSVKQSAECDARRFLTEAHVLATPLIIVTNTMIEYEA